MRTLHKNRWLIGMLGVLAFGFGVWMHSQHEERWVSVGIAASHSPQAVSTDRPSSDAENEMAPGTRQKLVQVLANIPYLQDIVVLPSRVGNGIEVSSEIQLKINSPVLPTEVNRWMSDYFRAVYRSGLPVVQAEVDVVQGDNILGTAGLGRTEFDALATATSSSAPQLSTEMHQAKQDMSTGPDELWYQTQWTVGN
ncbi:MAG: hypothetical protein OWQ59_11880 [Alicyclobacillaceae bacterium]|uniref:hypothetical protein n=1 Tax=Alicyclobacillus sp. SP_1 TaxID=2942475 RepID=UPI0021576304|nr:hypothetical protein [Alicyclobacillus sp. SP_1]MCY0889139.1 hypothetical protein [Alicyclobacillaceae bacterium]